MAEKKKGHSGTTAVAREGVEEEDSTILQSILYTVKVTIIMQYAGVTCLVHLVYSLIAFPCLISKHIKRVPLSSLLTSLIFGFVGEMALIFFMI